MLFEELQDGRHLRNCFSNASHLFWLNPTYIVRFGRRCRLKNFKMARISEENDFSNSKSLYSPKAPIKFQLNLTYCLGLNVVWRISRWPPWWPSWISERNNYSNSESLCCSDASYKVSAPSDLWFGRRCLKFEVAAMVAAILDIRMEWF